MQACLRLKALFGLPLRQSTGLVASLLKLAGLAGAVPDFSTLPRRPSGLNVAIRYRPSTGALHRLIGSPGIKAEGEGAWLARKHGPVQAQAMAQGASWITDPPIGKVSADGGYDTRGACAAIAARQNPRPWMENPLGRTIWRRWSGDHRRSLVEAKMRCFKLPGARVMAGDFERQRQRPRSGPQS